MSNDHKDLIDLSGSVATVAKLAPDFDGYDPYGSTMHVWFECAEELNRRDEEIPDEWDFRAGLGLDEGDELFKDYESPYLRMLGNTAKELSDVCKRLDLDY